MSDESRYFPGTESTEQEEAAASPAPARGGRRKRTVDSELVGATLADVKASTRRARKARVRWDADEAPIDGDYDALRLENADPRFEYFWCSDHDRGRHQRRGWIEERWGPGCARPKFYFGAQHKGDPIHFRELTLLKLPRERMELIRQSDPSRRRHAALMREILRPSAPGHASSFTEQTLQVGGG